MIDKTRVLDVVAERLRSLPVGHYLELRTYKRDRALLIVRRTEDQLRVLQRGFEEVDHEVDRAKLRRLLKSLLKKEFPRSNKVRLYTPGAFDEGAQTSKRKRL